MTCRILLMHHTIPDVLAVMSLFVFMIAWSHAGEPDSAFVPHKGPADLMLSCEFLTQHNPALR